MLSSVIVYGSQHCQCIVVVAIALGSPPLSMIGSPPRCDKSHHTLMRKNARFCCVCSGREHVA